jgi:hypothetical protein
LSSLGALAVDDRGGRARLAPLALARLEAQMMQRGQSGFQHPVFRHDGFFRHDRFFFNDRFRHDRFAFFFGFPGPFFPPTYAPAYYPPPYYYCGPPYYPPRAYAPPY